MTTAIQAACDANGVVIFPDTNVYLVSLTVSMSSNNQIIGNGATIKLKDSTVADQTDGGILYALQKTDISIDGLIIDGNKANNDTDGTHGDGIRIHDCQRVSITNNYIKNVTRNGIVIQRVIGGDGNEDILITDNLVVGSGSSAMTGGGEGILVVEGTWIIVTGNVCRGSKLRGIDIETNTTTIEKLTVSNNICDTNLTGIAINGAEATVADNILSDNTDFGIDIRSISNAILTVTGNFINTSTDGIFLENVQFITVSSNVIRECDNGIRMDGVASIIITGNAIDLSQDDGIEFNSGTNSNLIIVGNSIGRSDQSTAGNDNVSGEATKVLFSGNQLLSGGKADYGLRSAGAEWIITGNMLTSSGVTGEILDTSSAAIINNNAGYITENVGTGSIASGTTADVITHGASITPTASNISVTLTENPDNSPGAIWVGTITSTQFTVNCENDPGASHLDFSWRIG